MAMTGYKIFPILGFLLVLFLTGCDDKAKIISSCGDNFLDPGEACDGTALPVTECTELGFYVQNGTISCRSDCTIDTSVCSLFCGDDVIQGGEGEQCEGTNLNGNDCTTQGYSSGSLSCDAVTCRFDTTGCVSQCGNGILETVEGCDDGQLSPGDGCSALCQVEPGWECEGSPSICDPTCGDDLLVEGEVCDGSELDGRTCESEGFYTGDLACSAGCTLDLSGCEAGGFCGDTVIQDTFGEQCEGADLNESSCQDLDFWTGGLSCGDDCQYVTTGCLDIVSVVAGGRFTCVILSDRTVRCWGRNQRGQLGDGTTVDSLSAVTVGGLSNVASLGLGGSHACAVLTDGTLKCWGYNAYGQLGLGNIVDQSTPVTVPGLSGVQQVVGGERHTCAVLSTGAMKCWGYNGNGRLGDGTMVDRLSPVSVSNLTQIRSGAAGANHTCAQNNQGWVYCWGLNTFGQLGNNTITDSAVPVRAGSFTTADAVSAGYSHTCAHIYSNQNTDGGTAFCWGLNNYGQLGDGVTNHGTTCGGSDCSRTPVSIPNFTNTIAQLSLSPYSTCLRTDLGELWCWGRNDLGQVGDGSLLPRLNPVLVSTLSNVSSVWPTAGSHVCASRADSTELFCWGWNDAGQVGDQTLVNRSTPVAVVRP
ncbi:DUF4215 domain-containing protein [Myxococcota bacterium]|nr:DUF4215 domain-containing protein [Myxococcota bacterium]